MHDGLYVPRLSVTAPKEMTSMWGPEAREGVDM